MGLILLIFRPLRNPFIVYKHLPDKEVKNLEVLPHMGYEAFKLVRKQTICDSIYKSLQSSYNTNDSLNLELKISEIAGNEKVYSNIYTLSDLKFECDSLRLLYLELRDSKFQTKNTLQTKQITTDAEKREIFFDNVIYKLKGALFIPLIAFVIGYILLSFFNIIFLAGHNLEFKNAKSILKLKRKKLILYLRSFDVDEKIHEDFANIDIWDGHKIFYRNKSEEGQLADALKPLGELLAIINPYSLDSQTGVPKIKLKSENWKEKILKLKAQSEYYVFFLIIDFEITKGFIWELEALLEEGSYNKVIFILKWQEFSRDKILIFFKNILKNLKRSGSQKYISQIILEIKLRKKKDVNDNQSVGYLVYTNSSDKMQINQLLNFNNILPFVKKIKSKKEFYGNEFYYMYRLAFVNFYKNKERS